MKDEIRESNSLPGIKEFDEFPFFGTTPSHIVDGATLISAGNRPFLYRTRLGPQQGGGPQRNFRRGMIINLLLYMIQPRVLALLKNNNDNAVSLLFKMGNE